MSHTPGPWKAEWLFDAVVGFCKLYVSSEKRPIAHILRDEDEAAAHLMAAAPDLLKACEFALERLETRCKCETDDCSNHRAREMLRNAIAKARGESA